jgi:hypothetical protein
MHQLTTSRAQPSRDAIRGRVRELLVAEGSKETPRKQRLTAARIHRLLSREGDDVGATTVKAVARELRLELRDALKHAYLPLEYEPGEDAQVDFFEGVVDDRRLGRVKVNVLLVRACFTRPGSTTCRLGRVLRLRGSESKQVGRGRRTEPARARSARDVAGARASAWP